MEVHKSMTNNAVLSLFFGAFLISFSPVFVKVADVGPTVAGVYRVLFGGIVLLIIALLKKETFWRGWPRFLWPLFIGLIFAIDLTAWHRSIHYIGPGLSTILGNFQVFILSGYGVAILKEKLTPQFKLAVPLAMAGLVLIFGWDWQQFNLDYKIGFILGIATAITYASFTLTLRYNQARDDSLSPLVNLVIISFSTAIFMSIFSFIQGENFRIPDTKSWLAMLGYGIICQAAAWVIISKNLPRVRASLAGLVLLLQPTLAFVWDMAIFSRPTTIMEILGAIMALIAIYLGSFTNSKSN